MSPAPAPVAGTITTKTGGSTVKDSDSSVACTASAAATTSTRRVTTSSSHAKSPTSEGSGDTGREYGNVREEAKAGDLVGFEIEAGDGLTKDDAAYLTSILRKVSSVESN